MDAVNYIKFILALLFVLALIGLFALVVRRFGFGVPQVPFKRAADKRLGIVELMTIDAKRRLILVRRDDQEHLIMIGATSEIVVEANIVPPEEKNSEFSADLSKALDQVNDNAEQQDDHSS